MITKEITARDLRMHQGDVLDQVAFQKIHYVVTRHGKKVAVVVSNEDFQLLQKAKEFLEDEVDARNGKAAYKKFLKTGKAKPLEKIAKELGIDV